NPAHMIDAYMRETHPHLLHTLRETALLLPPNCPSVGSILHDKGICKPCVFAHKNSQVCKNQSACVFCHHLHHHTSRRANKHPPPPPPPDPLLIPSFDLIAYLDRALAKLCS